MNIGKIDPQQNFKSLHIKPSANKKLEELFEIIPSSTLRRVEYAQAVGSFQDRMKNNPVEVFLESNKEYWWGLKATVIKGRNKSVYNQSSMFNYDFLKEAVEKAENINTLNKMF